MQFFLTIFMNVPSYCLPLFFILGHVSGGHVTVTGGNYRIYITIMNMSLLNG
jgi:hypothetical protein